MRNNKYSTIKQIIRSARKVAFSIIEEDLNLKKEYNKLIREKIISEYSKYLDEVSFS